MSQGYVFYQVVFSRPATLISDLRKRSPSGLRYASLLSLRFACSVTGCTEALSVSVPEGQQPDEKDKSKIEAYKVEDRSL